MSNSAKQTEAAETGPVILAPDAYTRPVDPDQNPVLLGNECPACGAAFFPARTICPDCFDQGELVVKELTGRGEIHASTVVRIPAPVGIKAPYAYGYVDLMESGLRVFALFTGAEPEWFQPGREVQLTVGPVRLTKQGREIVGYKFKPVEQG